MFKNKWLLMISLVWVSGVWASGCMSAQRQVRPEDQPMAAIPMVAVVDLRPRVIQTPAGQTLVRAPRVMRDQQGLSVEERTMLEAFGGTPHRE